MTTSERLDVALKHHQAGQLDRAEKVYQQILDVDPQNTDALHLLGLVLHQKGNHRAALDHINRAISLAPKAATYLANAAAVYLAIGDLPNTIACCQRALEIDSKHYKAHYNLACAYQTQGKLEEALAGFRRTLQLKPDYAEALANLVHCQRHSDADQQLIRQLNELLARDNLSSAQRSHAHFALGKIYDDSSQYRLAFEHYQEGNALADVRFDAHQIEDLTNAIIKTCTHSLLKRGATIGNLSELPVVIVGMPRSGTSLVEQILASHPGVCGAGELQFLRHSAHELPAKLKTNIGYPACLTELDGAVAHEVADGYLALLQRCRPGAVRVTDKLPGNFMHLGLLALILPLARIIHCRRHPLDVCLSCFFRNFTNRMSFTYSLENLGLYYRQYEKLMVHWRQVLPTGMFEIDYEELVAAPEKKIRELVAFCGMEWDPACLEFHKTERVVQTASNWQVRQPMYQRAVGRWKHYEAYLGPLKDALK